MITTFNLAKHSFQLQSIETDIILYFLTIYFTENLLNGQFIDFINLTDIKLNWCYDFSLDNGIFGAWTPMFKNSLFLKPGTFNKQYLQYVSKHLDNQELQLQYTLYKTMQDSYNKDFIKIKDNKITYSIIGIQNKEWIKDYDKYKFLQYLFDLSTMFFVSTICHQLYHKYQFQNNSPFSQIYYCIDSFISLFIPYSLQCKCSFLREGDVRNKIDNEFNYKCLNNFNNVFSYFNQLAMVFKKNLIIKNYPELITPELQDEFSMYDNITKLNTKEYELILWICKKYNILSEEFLKLCQCK